MKIQWDYSYDLPQDQIRILEEHWEDSDEWAIIEILDADLETLIQKEHSQDII